MGTEKVSKLIMKLSPPVMLGLLIQSIYNIVDSYFVAQYSEAGLTALSLIFPIQLLMTALSTGTGTGLGILVSLMDGRGESREQKDLIKTGLFLGIINFLVFSTVTLCFNNVFFKMSSSQSAVRHYGTLYGKIIYIGSLGVFEEAICTKLLQARGNMVIPMIAQISGALVNLILDPILIYGLLGFPQMGVAGAALATVLGQWVAMGITLTAVLWRLDCSGKVQPKLGLMIYKAGSASILMQSLYTLYIVGLNLILKQFTEAAVTVLGIYYKLQTFFFIPLMGLQQVIVPVISYNHGMGSGERVREIRRMSILLSSAVMLIGMVIFLCIPGELLEIFTGNVEVLTIGKTALRIISLSFPPAGAVMMLTVYFQGLGQNKRSIAITVLRQIALLVPLAWLFHFCGLSYVWLTFPTTELLALIFSVWLYKRG